MTEVLRRIHAETDSSQTQSARLTPPEAAATVSDRIIAAETIIKLAPGTKVAYIERKAVITPSARDLARDRGIEFITAKTDTTQKSDPQLFIAQAEVRDRRVGYRSNNSSCGINKPATTIRRPCHDSRVARRTC